MGVIDIGSNSIKVLVARTGASGVEPVIQKTLEVRIGGKFDGEAIPESKMQSALEAVELLIREAKEAGAVRVRVIGTSALREASNASWLVDAVRQTTGEDLEIISGEEEARLIGRGIRTDPAWVGMDSFAVMDQGGGSLEVIVFRKGNVATAWSLSLGAVRMFSRFPSEADGVLDPGVQAECAASSRRELELAGVAGFDWSGLAWAGTGGAFTMTRLVQAQGKELTGQSPWLERVGIQDVMQTLAAMPMARRLEIPGLPANRADILPISLIPVLEVMQIARADRIMHSFHNLRFGAAADMMG